MTLIGVENGRAMIAAVTRQKLKQAERSIWLTWKVVVPADSAEREKMSAWELVMSIRGGPTGGTMDWAYIFDRNRDGGVDYLAYLYGPAQTAPAGWTGELPSQPKTKEELLFIYKSHEMTFWHLADDNYDGRDDGVFIRLRDVKTNWLDAWLIARDANFDGDYETCRWFEEGRESNWRRSAHGPARPTRRRENNWAAWTAFRLLTSGPSCSGSMTG